MMPCAVQRAIVAGTKRRARADLPAFGIPRRDQHGHRRHNAQLAYQPDARNRGEATTNEPHPLQPTAKDLSVVNEAAD
jgi:hypothetical protein